MQTAMKNLISHKITTKPSSQKISFIVYPLDKNGNFYDTKFQNTCFINSDDFNIVREIFERNLPKICPIFGKKTHGIDDTSNNIFGKNEIISCLNELENLTEPKPFLDELAAYLREMIEYAVFIDFEGNL